jgi:hypothetical protein
MLLQSRNILDKVFTDTRLFVHRTLVYYTIALNCIFALVQWLIYCLQCIPLDAFFHRQDYPTVRCLDNSVLAFVPASLVSIPPKKNPYLANHEA